MRTVLYRFPDLEEFERLVRGALADPELQLPAGETVDDGEWVLAIFELGAGRRATSAAGRAAVLPEGARLTFEPRDVRRLSDFAAGDARAAAPGQPSSESAARTSCDSRASDEAVEATRNTRPSAAPPPKVLVVDDDPDIRDVVAAMLEAVGLAVQVVDSAEAALERITADAFDLLVLDWNLPKMTGLDLCRTLRKDTAVAHLPVLFLTANASSQDMVEAFAGGADDYVVKPFRAPELGARIFSLLRRARK